MWGRIEKYRMFICYSRNLIVGHELWCMLSTLDDIALQKAWQLLMTHIVLDKKCKLTTTKHSQTSIADLGFEPATSGTAVGCVNLNAIKASDNAQFSQVMHRNINTTSAMCGSHFL